MDNAISTERGAEVSESTASESKSAPSTASHSGPAFVPSEKAPRQLQYFMDGAWHTSNTQKQLGVTQAGGSSAQRN